MKSGVLVFSMLIITLHLSEARIEALFRSTEIYQQCLNNSQDRNTRIPPLYITWHCMRNSSNSTTGFENLTDTTDITWLREVLFATQGNEVTEHPRIRKEYRTLSEDERNQFHSALRQLKNDLLPDGTSKYDAIAKLHSGQRVLLGHRGPAFLTWHRQYLLIMEDALRQYEPDIAIPYWDSTMDNELDNPAESLIFHDDFIGSKGELVINGPFRKWPSPSMPLSRLVGAEGKLYSKEDFEAYVNQTTLGNVTIPLGLKENTIELKHNQIHDWIGGHMQHLQTAPYDPIFFIHHSFVDYIYESFRQAQISKGIVPGTDWPDNNKQSFHYGKRKIPISDSMTNEDMAKMDISPIYTYAKRPTCTESDKECGSPYLKCKKDVQYCIPLTQTEYETQLNQGIAVLSNNGIKSLQINIPRIHNTFCIEDNKCDAKYWVYLAVNIIQENNDKSDMFAGAKHKFQTFHIESYGLSYNGKFSEIVALDVSQVVSGTTAIVAVKNPRYGESSALIHVYNNKGKKCRAVCLTNNGTTYTECIGAIKATSDNPLEFSVTDRQALYSIWRWDSANHVLSFNNANRTLSFTC